MDKIDLTQSHNVIGAYKSQDYSKVREKYQDEGTKYAFSVLDEKQIAGYLMKLACFRHVQDLRRIDECNDFEYYYDLKKVNSILEFAKLCPDVNARHPLPLMPWQKFILAELNGWQDQFNDDRFIEAEVSVARKQGKTYFAGIDLAYSYLIEGYGLSNQDFLAAANTTDQIDKLFGYTAFMIEYLIKNNPVFKKIQKDEKILIQEKIIKTKRSINNRFVRISNESGKFDGYHFMKAIYDEAGDEKAGKYTSRIATGQTDVPHHQFIKISTAYEFIGTEFYNDIKRLIESMEKDYDRANDDQLCLVWAQDSENEAFKPDTWEKSNPLITFSENKDKNIQSIIKLRDSLENKGKMAEFQNKTMNIYLQTKKDSYLKLADVESATVPDFDIHGREVYIGFDYSLASDNTAFGFAFPYFDERNQPKFHLLQHSFIPWNHAGSIEAKEKQDGINYRELEKKGFCTITSHLQGLINVDQVYKWLLNFVEENELKVIYFGYDRYGSYQVKNLTESLLANQPSWLVQDLRQITSVLSDPTKFLQEIFVTHKVSRLDDAVLEKALLNSVIKADKIGIQVDKDKATMKIDVVDALINALAQGMHHFDNNSSFNSESERLKRMSADELEAWYKEKGLI